MDVVDVDWLLVLVDGVRHFYVGHDEISFMEMESPTRNFLCRMSWSSGGVCVVVVWLADVDEVVALLG